MDRTIEDKFLMAFKQFRTVDNCIDYMKQKYDLRLYDSNQTLPANWQKYYNEDLPKQIIEQFNAFDNGGITCFDSPLMVEVEANFNKCTTDKERERYIFSLLTPFKRYSDIYNPTARIEELERSIEETEKDKLFWEGLTGDDIEMAQKQIAACNQNIEQSKKYIELHKDISKRFRELTGMFYEGAEWMKNGTVEACLSGFCSYAYRFGERLYALLITYGIDLKALQRKCGIYLINHINITDIEDYIGSRELAQEYLNKLHTQPQIEVPIQSAPTPQLPKTLNDDQILKLYNYLTTNDWIEQIDKNSFSYIFGANCTPVTNQITWSKTKTKQHLREMLVTIYKNHKPFSNIERIVTQVFVYKNKPMKLAKNKPTPSLDSDNMKDFLATL